MHRVDYSELVEALQEGDEKRAAALLSEVIPRLEDYLCTVMSASESVAQECVQQTIFEVLVQIRKESIREQKAFLKYLLTSCRNKYLSYVKYQYRFVDGDDSALSVSRPAPAEQLQNLLDEERQKILEKCLDELDGESRRFISYWIQHPEKSYKKIASRFNLTESTVRTRKSRIIKILNLCYQKRSSE